MTGEFLTDGDDLEVVENCDDGDDSDEPREEIAAVSPGDVVTIGPVECSILSTGERVNFGQRGLYSLTLPWTGEFGAVATLYVDRDPYRLDVCNGKVYDVDPSEVVVRDE